MSKSLEVLSSIQLAMSTRLSVKSTDRHRVRFNKFKSDTSAAAGDESKLEFLCVLNIASAKQDDGSYAYSSQPVATAVLLSYVLYGLPSGLPSGSLATMKSDKLLRLLAYLSSAIGTDEAMLSALDNPGATGAIVRAFLSDAARVKPRLRDSHFADVANLRSALPFAAEDSFIYNDFVFDIVTDERRDELSHLVVKFNSLLVSFSLARQRYSSEVSFPTMFNMLDMLQCNEVAGEAAALTAAIKHIALAATWWRSALLSPIAMPDEHALVPSMRLVAMGPIDTVCPVTRVDDSREFSEDALLRCVNDNYINARVLWTAQGALPGDAAMVRSTTTRLFSAPALHAIAMIDRRNTTRRALSGMYPPVIMTVLTSYTMLRRTTFESLDGAAIPLGIDDRESVAWRGELPACITAGKYSGCDRPIGLMMQGLLRLLDGPLEARSPTASSPGHMMRILQFECVGQAYILLTYCCNTATTVPRAVAAVRASLGAGAEGSDTDSTRAHLANNVRKLALSTFGISPASVASADTGVWTLSHYTVEAADVKLRLYDCTRLVDEGDGKLVIALRTHASSADSLYVLRASAGVKTFPTLYPPGSKEDEALRGAACYTRKKLGAAYVPAIGFCTDSPSIVYFED